MAEHGKNLRPALIKTLPLGSKSKGKKGKIKAPLLRGTTGLRKRLSKLTSNAGKAVTMGAMMVGGRVVPALKREAMARTVLGALRAKQKK